MSPDLSVVAYIAIEFAGFVGIATIVSHPD